MKGLTPVREGIYSLDGFCVYPQPELAVVVHPFFGIEYLENTSYLSNLYRFLDNFTGPVITLEEYHKLEKTINDYKRSKKTFNRFFVATKDCDPQPEEIGWEDMKDFIKTFKPSKIKAAGGYYDYYKGCNYSGDGGCLGITIDTLRKDFNNIEIVKGCTF